MKTFRAIIVDDERLARSELRTLLRPFLQITVLGEAANATEALGLCADLKPDLLFLDVEMPGRNGLDLVESLRPPIPEIIFTTAFDAFAVRAFEVNALDYLLKPIAPERLQMALEKLEQDATPMADLPAMTEAPLTDTDQVMVRDGERCWFIPVASIRLLEAEGNYTRVFFENQRPLIYRTIASMEARLPERMFLRANRSQLVNLRHIDSVGRWFSGGLKVNLRGGQEIEFSRRQAQLFRERLSL